MEVSSNQGEVTKPSSATGGGGGPGRKARACLECKKLKMKCEVFPGDRKCRHCLRRNVDCLMAKRSQHNAIDAGDRISLEAMESYEEKIDAMRAEIQQMRQSLDAVLAERSQEARLVPVRDFAHEPPAPTIPPTVFRREEQQAARTLLAVNQQQAPPLCTPGSTTSPAGLSGREDNTQMAMTRENSVEPQSNSDQANGPVTLEDPMGSLYEVTRLRNIRSNKSKTTRPLPESQEELNDFISRGVISEAEAEELYDIFHRSLNHYLWVGLEQTHDSFNSVRKSSELLTATILTVTALHIPTSAATFDACYKEFLSLISSSMFSRYHAIDDVRGLCIAAFWLSDVSWKLSGHAIRIATELNIHQSFSRALEGDREHFLRARLWYMLYVCDHHFSIAYGRPPMIAESTQIREHELFLLSPHADALDARILSQVSLMQILTRVYERFAEKKPSVLGQGRAGVSVGRGGGMPGSVHSISGAMTTVPTTSVPEMVGHSPEINLLHGAGAAGASLPSQPSLSPNTNSSHTAGSNVFILPQGSSNGTSNGTSTSGTDPSAAMLTSADFDALRAFNLEIDQWRMLWHTRQTTNYFIGTFPPKGIILYSYFAKLQLNSLAVRGVSLSSTGSGRLSTERKEFANMSISAAASILTFVLEEDDMRRALVGTPLYVHTMIAFASVFLMKVATKWNRAMGLNIEEGYVTRLLGRMIGVLKSAITSDRHVLRHIAAGLEKMLEKMEESRALRDGAEGSAERAQGDAMQGVSEGQGFGGGYYSGSSASFNPGSNFPPSLGVPGGGSMGMHMPTPGSWDSGAAYGPPTGGGSDFFGDGLTDMNGNLMYEAFGTGSANDVYNMLSSQFSF